MHRMFPVTFNCIVTLTTLSLGNVQQWDRGCCLMPFWIMPNDELRSLKQSDNTSDRSLMTSHTVIHFLKSSSMKQLKFGHRLKNIIDDVVI